MNLQAQAKNRGNANSRNGFKRAAAGRGKVGGILSRQERKWRKQS